VSRSSRLPILVVAGAFALGLCASAQAAIITVGSPAKAGVTPAPVNNIVTFIEPTLTEVGANVVSPVNGVIIRWNITGFVGGPFILRVLTPVGGLSYTGGAGSAPEVPTSKATQTFATSMPIKAGQTIGIDNTNASDELGAFTAPGASFAFFKPPLAEGVTMASTTPTSGIELAYNAEVQPAPTITAINPASGSFKGGTAVTITGTDFEGASAVTFGGTPAESFTVNSESQVSAVAPPAAAGSKFPIAISTVAGTATSATTFASTACVVPKLKGEKLIPSKKKLTKADCKLGKVKKIEGVTGKTGKVVKQNPKPGKALAPGTKVKVILGG
jgi:IPT/TIG domain/PASTA domain